MFSSLFLSTFNELDDFKGCPTIKLIKAGENEIVDFYGDRTEAGVLKFLNEQVEEEKDAKDEF